MSIVEQITRIQTNIANAYSSCEAKGATLPEIQNSDNLASVIDSIENNGSGGSGETIEVLNKTGAVINQGDKVWLNENYQGEVGSFEVGNATASGGCIDRTGTFAVANNKGYSIGNEEAVYAYDVSGGNPKVLFYGDDNSILTGDNNAIYRIDGKAQFRLSNSSAVSLCSKYLSTLSYQSSGLYELNMTTGETVKYWNLSAGVHSVVVVDNTVYAFSSVPGNYVYYADLPEESGGTITLATKASVANHTNNYFLPLGVTTDNKYIVMAYGSKTSTSLNGITFFEILGKGQLKELSSGELPTDLQPYYSSSCSIAFNPYTGVLTACEYGKANGSYVIMKYTNGEWVKLPIEITPAIGASNNGPITLSDDLSKAFVINYTSTANYRPYIKNLTTTEGYGAIAYNTRNITENTLTGYAMTDAEPNEEVIVGIASVPGSTPSVIGGSDTFESQLLLENLVNSGNLNNEEEIVNQTTSVLENLLGE